MKKALMIACGEDKGLERRVFFENAARLMGIKA